MPQPILRPATQRRPWIGGPVGGAYTAPLPCTVVPDAALSVILQTPQVQILAAPLRRYVAPPVYLVGYRPDENTVLANPSPILLPNPLRPPPVTPPPVYLLGSDPFTAHFLPILPPQVLPAPPPYNPSTPTTIVSYGAVEYGSGLIINLNQSYGYPIVGPFQTTDRTQMRVKVIARGTSNFNLNYEFSTDQGTTWYVGEQKASTASSADDGSGYAQDAHANFNVGYWWRVCVYNTNGATENIAFEWRLHEY